MPSKQDSTARVVQAGVLAWLLPGAGHFYLGKRGFAAVFCIAITLPFLFGVAVGGLKKSINPQDNRWLFLAELGIGSYTGIGYVISSRLIPDGPQYVSTFPESEIAQIYLSVAGLLNVLAILDAMMRAQTGGLPVFFTEMRPAPAEPEAGEEP